MGFFSSLFGNNNGNSNQQRNYSSNGAHYTVTYDPPEQHARILVDSLRLLESTTNPDTYFSRYKLAGNEACHISDYRGVVWNGMNAAQIERMLREESSMNMLHRKFIDRLFAEGKEDRLTFQMYEVGGYMTKSTLAYFKQKLGGKKYHFCKIRFNDMSNKLYTYVTKDKSVTIGDTVTIPTGNGYVPESKVMQVVEVFDGSLDELGFPIENLRCVERKLKSIVCPHCGASIQINTSEKLGKCTKCQSEFYFI